MAGVMKRSAENLQLSILRNKSLINVSCIRLNSTDNAGESEVKPLRTTKLSAFKRGTGGRSSFNGIVATVFGCTGFTGRYIVNKLGKQGTQVICPYRGDYYKPRTLKLAGDLGQIQFLNLDFNDDESIYKAVKYSNVVINLIGRDNATWNYSLDDVNVKGARRIARISREAGVERLIHISALNASEHPKSVIIKNGSQFLKSKWQGEMAVREEFPDAIIFRPADIFGNSDRFLFYYSGYWRRTGHSVPLWNKGVGIVKQPVFASDFAKGVVNSVFEPNAPGKIYQAVGPKRHELGELIDWMYRVMRRTDDWNYKRTDMKYDLRFRLRVGITERMMKVRPNVCWDRLETDHVTDEVDSKLPTLEDLGVTLTAIEDRGGWELRIFRAHGNYNAALGEFDDPLPPPVVAEL